MSFVRNDIPKGGTACLQAVNSRAGVRAILNSQFRIQNSRPARRGVGLVELLVALAISATLLTATAAAINASFTAYQVNQEQANLMQQGRVAMHRILTGIRTSKEHAPENPADAANFSAGVTVTGTALAMFDNNDAEIIYRHDAANQQIIAEIDGTARVLARGVTAFTIKMEPMRSADSFKYGTGHDLLKRATVLISLRTNAATSQGSETTGDQTITLSASAVPRRNAW